MQPERLVPPPASFGGHERVPSSPGPEQPAEAQPQRTPEQQPAAERPEQQSAAQAQNSGAPVAPAVNLPPAMAPAAPAAPAPAGPVGSGNPLTADDADVIEKAWVDRAKAIIRDTRDDPHRKEQEVSRLQADYLEKRFGVQVKLPQE